MLIKYVKGDATDPGGEGPRIIVHCCNDAGRWGAGFVVPLGRRYPNVKESYLGLFERPENPKLGDVQFVVAGKDLFVANLIGQRGTGAGAGGLPPVRYESIRLGLERVRRKALSLGASVHMPRMGCGLAGGDWYLVERIVREELVDHGVEAVVYDLP